MSTEHNLQPPNPLRDPNMTSPPPTSSSSLFRALVQCFLVIFLGYCAGKWRLVTRDGAAGLGRFVGTFALPALLFREMCRLDFGSVDWRFLGAVLFSKSAIFLATLILTLLVHLRRVSAAASLAGLAAVFATQSNDFALGLPILRAVFVQREDLVKYVYLLAPISLVVLNPLAFFLLEWDKRRSTPTPPDDATSGADAAPPRRFSACRAISRVIVGVFSNPIVFMTLLGIVGNASFSGRVPLFVTFVLETLGDAYPGAALFLLGVSIAGQIRASFTFANLLLPSFLIFVKLIVTPMVNHRAASLIAANDTQDLAMFAFLYGTFPTAPTVFVIANQYQCAPQVFASGLVLCTFLSAPLMFVSASMATLSTSLSRFVEFNRMLQTTGVDISYLSIVLCLLTVAYLLATREFRRLPHALTLLLTLSVLKTCVGVVVFPHVTDKRGWVGGIVSYMILGGTFCSRASAAFLAVALCLSAYERPGRKALALSACVGYVLCIVGAVLVVHFRREAMIAPTLAFRFGIGQTVASLVVLMLTGATILAALVLLMRVIIKERGGGENGGYVALPREEEEEEEEERDGSEAESTEDPSSSPTLTPSPSDLTPRSSSSDYPSPQLTRHVILLFLTLVGIVVGAFLCVWRLDIELTNGPESKRRKLTSSFTLLEFLDYIFNYGQGFFIFALFALDTRRFLVPLRDWGRSLVRRLIRRCWE